MATTKKGKCSKASGHKGCIEEVGNYWRVRSNRSGSLWKAKYASKELAQAALQAYHVNKIQGLSGFKEFVKKGYEKTKELAKKGVNKGKKEAAIQKWKFVIKYLGINADKKIKNKEISKHEYDIIKEAQYFIAKNGWIEPNYLSGIKTIKKEFQKNKNGVNIQIPQTIKESNYKGYVYLYNGNKWIRRHTKDLPQNDNFIVIGEGIGKKIRIEFTGLSGMFTNTKKMLLNVSLHNTADGISRIFAMFDFAPPAGELKLIQVAEGSNVSEAVKNAKASKYGAFIEAWEQTHKPLKDIKASFWGITGKFIIKYGTARYYYAIMPIFGFMTTDEKNAAKVFESKAKAQEKINKLSPDHRKKCKIVEI